jgi:hypothetical protein
MEIEEGSRRGEDSFCRGIAKKPVEGTNRIAEKKELNRST